MTFCDTKMLKIWLRSNTEIRYIFKILVSMHLVMSLEQYSKYQPESVVTLSISPALIKGTSDQAKCNMNNVIRHG